MSDELPPELLLTLSLLALAVIVGLVSFWKSLSEKDSELKSKDNKNK